ncbi:MAG: hypothetical protein KC620_09455, partial [Myxococcales bacterium]|nr:hypothetical protein [Myxococcales bacterium]
MDDLWTEMTSWFTQERLFDLLRLSAWVAGGVVGARLLAIGAGRFALSLGVGSHMLVRRVVWYGLLV